MPLSHRQRLVLPCADNTYVTKAAAKVKSHLPALRCVGSESRKHELTAVLDELDGKTGYAELIGELDRLLVYYRRTVAVRKGRRSAAKERAKSREHRGNVNMQSGRKELDIQGVRDELGNLKKQNVQGMQGSREKQDTQKPYINTSLFSDKANMPQGVKGRPS